MSYHDQESPGIHLFAGLSDRADAIMSQTAMMRELEGYASRFSGVRNRIRDILSEHPSTHKEALNHLLEEARQGIFLEDHENEKTPKPIDISNVMDDIRREAIERHRHKLLQGQPQTPPLQEVYDGPGNILVSQPTVTDGPYNHLLTPTEKMQLLARRMGTYFSNARPNTAMQEVQAELSPDRPLTLQDVLSPSDLRYDDPHTMQTDGPNSEIWSEK